MAADKPEDGTPGKDQGATPPAGGGATPKGAAADNPASPKTPASPPKEPAKDKAAPPPAAKKPAAKKGAVEVDKGLITRRKMVWASTTGVLGLWLFATLRFFFPRVLFEPSTRFKIGFPDDFGLGVDTKFQQAYRIWVVRDPSSLYVIFAKCSHLGCTPDWKESENKFKCPCHGSGFDSEGVNFEGPAPRPMDRAYVELDPEGQIIVDKSRLFGPDDWKEKGVSIPV